MDDPARAAAVIAELEALLATSHAQRSALRELLAVVVRHLDATDRSPERR